MPALKHFLTMDEDCICEQQQEVEEFKQIKAAMELESEFNKPKPCMIIREDKGLQPERKLQMEYFAEEVFV